MFRPKFVEENIDEIKEYLIYEENRKAFLALQPTDWMVVRQLEDSSKTLPTEIAQYRNDVRAAANANCAAWASCNTLQDVYALTSVPAVIDDPDNPNTANLIQNPVSTLKMEPIYPVSSNTYSGLGE